MKYPQVVVYEHDGRLAELVRPLTEAHGWALREPRQLDTCLREGTPVCQFADRSESH